MSIELAVRYTEIFLGFALIQQSLEHLSIEGEAKRFFFPRIGLAFFLLFGISIQWTTLLLLVHGIYLLRYFSLFYNGGSDRMNLFILLCLTGFHWSTEIYLREIFIGYLALQVLFSYSIAGVFKALNIEWWKGEVLRNIFQFSVFPASEALRDLAKHKSLLTLISCLVILFELLFPLALLNKTFLLIALFLAMTFHLLVFYFFGFNRFVWTWLAAYPSLIWLQGRISQILMVSF